MDLFDGIEVDRSILEQTNPIFNTAKMTLYILGEIGDENAQAISDKLGLTFEETQDSRSHQVSRKSHIAELINMENRFRTLGALAEKSGCDVCIDLPCGYTPRAIEFARKGIRFVGLDLPAAIEEGEPVIRSLMSEEENELVSFKAVDATNYASLEAALEGVEGSVCITTEGLLFYFAESEIAALCANIRRILAEHGGCWLLADPEINLIYITILKIVCGDRFMEILARSRSRTVEKSDVELGLNPITIRPQDTEQSMRAAMMFMAKQGFKVERLPVAEYMPELVSLSELDAESVAAYKEAMQRLAYWKVTLAPAAQELDASVTESKQFKAQAQLEGSILRLALQGRLDTISAPSLLAFYNQHKDQITAVEVDCADLAYVSSAGLRVLLIMFKGCADGVVLHNVGDTVREVIEQTGMANLLTMD